MSPVRRYRALGGSASWWAPVLWILLVAAGVAMREWTLAAVLAAAGVIVRGLEPAVVIEVSAAGLSRGFMLAGRFVGTPRVLAWSSVLTIETRWRIPNDFTVLETVVGGGRGERLGFTTRMGLPAYRALLREVAGTAAEAPQLGLTGRLLAEWDTAEATDTYSADPGLVLAVALIVAWGLLLPWIFNRY